MKNLIKNQTAFITGASSGIGKACAEKFASLGVHLVITARRIDRLNNVAKELSAQYGVKCLPIQLDVQSHEQVEAVFKKLEMDKIEMDILVNNAGLALSYDRIQEGKISNWDTMIDTNIKGLLYVTKAALPSMLKKNRGHIINIGSIAGHECYPSGNIYSATKFAVKAISKSLRLDLFGTAIRVSEVDPELLKQNLAKCVGRTRKRQNNSITVSIH